MMLDDAIGTAHVRLPGALVQYSNGPQSTVTSSSVTVSIAMSVMISLALLSLSTLRPIATRAVVGPPVVANPAATHLRDADSAIRDAHDAESCRKMEALFRPVATERRPCACGGTSLPADLQRGALLRNGPNARPGWASGGWLDGDAMVHAVCLPPDEVGSRPMYSRAWLRTSGFAKEEAAGERLFDGSLVAPFGIKLLAGLARNAFRAAQPQKDTANTAFVTLDGGRVLALMEQHLPCELRVSRGGAIRTVQAVQDLGGKLIDWGAFPFSGGALTAHLKRDPISRQAVGVSYASAGDPSARVSMIAADGTVTRILAVPLRDASAQVMIHDTAITRGARDASKGGDNCGWVVLLDLPLTVRPARMLRDKFPVEYEPSHGARIGLMPRSCAKSAEAAERTVWVDVEPCVVLHTMNAYEESDGTVVLTALRSLPTTPESFIASYSTAYLYQWVIDPHSGVCISERCLSSRPLEFPALDPRLVGLKARYGYAITPCTAGGPNRFGPPGEGILINGVAKLDLQSGEQVAAWTTPDGWWVVSEPTFVPKTGASAVGDGDAGYLLFFCMQVEHANGEPLPDSERGDGRASRLYVLDAAQLDGEPAAVIELPGVVPYGLHSTWVPFEDLAADDEALPTADSSGTAATAGVLSPDAARFTFDAFDQNRDGLITREEITLASRALGRPLTEEQVAQLVQSANLNRDGVIDADEWVRVLRAAELIDEKFT